MSIYGFAIERTLILIKMVGNENKTYISALIFSLGILIIGCRINEPEPAKLELFKLGTPEQLDFNNLFKKGAEQYFIFSQNSDSAFIKSYKVINPKSGEPIRPDSIYSQYYWKQLDQKEKSNVNASIQFLLKYPNQIISIPKINPQISNCFPFGEWIAVLTDSTNTKHYFSFSNDSIPGFLSDLCSQTNQFTYLLNSKYAIIKNQKINTDSLVKYYIENRLKHNLFNSCRKRFR